MKFSLSNTSHAKQENAMKHPVGGPSDMLDGECQRWREGATSDWIY